MALMNERWEAFVVGVLCGLVAGVVLTMVITVWGTPVVLLPLLGGTVGVFVFSLAVGLLVKAGEVTYSWLRRVIASAR
jgi:hypothetical protein